ncbi:MAG: hypothetical protein K2N39_07190 [Lachnospiraceae bacterium]|nr:hypothetical protein [Lachnospiraceae bacterium]
MEYEEFKEMVLKGLQDIYCGDATVRTERILKNNGKHYDGIVVELNGGKGRISPVIPLEWFYRLYHSGNADMEGCIRIIAKVCEEHRETDGVRELLQGMACWEQIRGDIYPILLSTKENQEMLKRVVSIPMLDMSVVYIARGKIGGRCAGIKIDHRMLEIYGISAEQLHKRAMKNLMDDGYHFKDIYRFAVEQGYLEQDGPDLEEAGKTEKAYILTNAVKFYGAAGILDRKLVREFAGGKNFFILPSSVNETIFVPAGDGSGMEKYNRMVKMVNEKDTDVEERLTDHAYFYDGTADEIRMCA